MNRLFLSWFTFSFSGGSLRIDTRGRLTFPVSWKKGSTSCCRISALISLTLFFFSTLMTGFLARGFFGPSAVFRRLKRFPVHLARAREERLRVRPVCRNPSAMMAVSFRGEMWVVTMMAREKMISISRQVPTMFR